MMVDTGATHTVVPEDVLLALGLRSRGTTSVRTSMQQVTQQPAYQPIVSLEVEDLGGQVHVAEFSLGVIGRPCPPATSAIARLPFEGLLGLDILRSSLRRHVEAAFRANRESAMRELEAVVATLGRRVVPAQGKGGGRSCSAREASDPGTTSSGPR